MQNTYFKDGKIYYNLPPEEYNKEGVYPLSETKEEIEKMNTSQVRELIKNTVEKFITKK